ncbi:ANTAR domain-containing protein [Streptomyces ochraceiscleroticus]|uniref:ANTAR domain-containing protein n=1 Tax=Streptomyces ochraceiscleroticus TaxID=47761 RepID=A0ABW1MIN1_9ACTN|nr:ANTAR domain-containing protein [Streptomyces ochraceiscleroticus]
MAYYLARHHDGSGSIAVACRAALQAPCSVGLTLAADAALARRISLCCDGPLADAGETLEINLGEGPCVQALQQRASVLADDLTDLGATRLWPLFADEAQAQGIHAAFALPAVSHPRFADRAGIVLSLYRDRSGPLSPTDQHTARIHLDAAQLLLQAACAAAPEDDSELLVPHFAPSQAVVHQAVGMIIQRHDLSADHALDRLRAHAHSRGIDLTDLAHAVVHEDLDLPDY